MRNSIEELRTEVDEIKTSLNALKEDVTISEIEKKDIAEKLKRQAEITKEKVETTIKTLEKKTDESSKKKKEEAKTLLNSFNEIVKLYSSITNPVEIPTSIGSQTKNDSKGIFGWIWEQWNNIRKKEKWSTEWWKNILRTGFFLWTSTLAFKLIKKLFWWWKDNKEDNNEDYKSKENTRENDREKTDANEETNEEENNNNNENYAETSENDTKEKKKESIWSKLWWKALAWLWIVPAAWTAVAAWTAATSDKWFDLWTNEETQKSEGTSNESDKEKKSDSSVTENKPENDSSKKKSEDSNTKKDWKESKETDNEWKTYTNSKSGITYHKYDQGDPRRRNKIKKGKGWPSTMNATGCLLTAAAVVDWDPTHTPDYYRQNYAGRCPYDSIPKASQHRRESKVLLPGEPQKKNARSREKTQRAITEMIKHLEKWYPVVFMVHWGGKRGDNKLTGGQHYMAAIDIREKNGEKEVYIGNTHNGKWWGRVPVNTAFTSVKQASIYTPAQA